MPGHFVKYLYIPRYYALWNLRILYRILKNAEFLNPRRHRPIRILPMHKGGGGGYDPVPFRPDWARASRKKLACSSPLDEAIGIELKLLGQPVTSGVRSSADKRRKPVIDDNFASDGARSKFQRPACSSRQVEHVSMVFIHTEDF